MAVRLVTVSDDVYIRALEQLLQAFPEGRVSLWFDNRPEPYTYYFEVKPRNARSASIRGMIERDGDIEITIGSVTTALESNRSYNDPKQVEQFKQICAAVIAGKYEEQVYSVDKVRLGVVGIVHLPTMDRKFKTIDRLSLKWLSSRERVEKVTFDPY